MAGISRRAFLKRSGGSAAAVGALAALPSIAMPRSLRAPRPATIHDRGVAAPSGRAATGPLVVHVPDPRSGEVHLMVGTREVITRDPALVAHLVKSAG